MKFLLTLIFSTLALNAFGEESSPRKDFTGVDDLGAKVTCAYVGTEEGLSQSHYTCQFPKESRRIVAVGNRTNEKTWCEVRDGEVKMFDCVAGIGDFAHFFVTTDAGSTGLIACRLAFSPLKPTGTVICSNHHNPVAGIFGSAKDRKNVALCTDAKGNQLLIDQVTAVRDGFRVGDYGGIRFAPATRTTLWADRLVRTEDKGFTSFTGKDFAFKMVSRPVLENEAFVGLLKLSAEPYFSRVDCRTGTVK